MSKAPKESLTCGFRLGEVLEYSDGRLPFSASCRVLRAQRAERLPDLEVAMTMVSPVPADAAAAFDRASVLRRVDDRVLWLSTAIIDHANRVRPNPSGLKVGGHQASSASMVTIMTALWFEHLRPEDRVSVKPHASPVLHAINYLLGELDESYLTTLREFGGLQSYPSRSKDPDAVDYSTGSVGIGATAPIWGALARRYVTGHFGTGGRGPAVLAARRRRTGRGRLLGGDHRPDGRRAGRGRLDRRPEPAVAGPGRRRTSARPRLEGMFAAAGWQALTVKYGRLLEDLFARPGGDALRRAHRRR